LDSQGVGVQVSIFSRIFISYPDRLWAHEASYPMSTGEGALSMGAKQPGCEADRSLPASAEVKKTPYIFMA
jgi:hypothetical protein